jgi:hypothetical protein
MKKRPPISAAAKRKLAQASAQRRGQELRAKKAEGLKHMHAYISRYLAANPDGPTLKNKG